jgi:hypothetical protein
MIAKTRPTFWRAYNRLSEQVKDQARAAYRQFAENPFHPSLHFKKLGGAQNVWVSASLGTISCRWRPFR